MILIFDVQLEKDMFMQKFTNNRTYVKLVLLILECSRAWTYYEFWRQISEIFGCLWARHCKVRREYDTKRKILILIKISSECEIVFQRNERFGENRLSLEAACTANANEVINPCDTRYNGSCYLALANQDSHSKASQFK